MNQASKFLKKGYEVKVTIRMKGREKRTLLWRAKELMERFLELGKVKHHPRLNGSAYIATIT